MKARISYFKIAVVKIGAEILSYIQKQNKTTDNKAISERQLKLFNSINVVAQSYDQKEKVREV